MITSRTKLWIVLWSITLVLTACKNLPAPGVSKTGKLSVVATTTIVGDVVRNVGGDGVDVVTLLPLGLDPHSFQPTPQDVAKVANADLIFANGAGLEEFLKPMLENAGSKAEIVSVSEGIQLLQSQEVQSGDLSVGDPHTWFDPNLVIVWSQNIAKKLGEVDSAQAVVYTANAQKYIDQLKELDAWIQEQVAQIPEANRKLVTDHASFTYFAARYGFQQVGAVIPGYSTLAQPSAQELAGLEDAIRNLGVKAIFVGETVNPALSQRVAQDTGSQLITLYNGSLSGPDGPAANYLDFMRYDVSMIVKALK